MTNAYYNHSGYPSTGAPGSSASLRAELDSITSGFNLLPAIGGNPNQLLSVNSGATALQSVTGVTTDNLGGLALKGALTVDGAVSGAGFTNLFTTTFASPPALGSTTPAAVSATTLSASGTVSGVGFSNYLASPPAIGGTTPNNGTFNILTANTRLISNSVGSVAGALSLVANNAVVATIDSGGNMGLAVTPSAWSQSGSAYKALQYGVSGSLFGRTGNEIAALASNVYATGSNAYAYMLSSNYASMYTQSSGAHNWYTAPVGTAGNPVSFTQSMTLDANGNLGIGVVPSPWSLPDRAIELAGAGTSIFSNGLNLLGLGENYYSSATGDRYAVDGPAAVYELVSGGHYWFTAPSGAAGARATFTPAMTLDNSGNLANAGTFNSHKRAWTTPVVVDFSATPTFDASASNFFIFGNLTSNVTSVSVPNAADGQVLSIRFRQDATGGRTVTLGTMGAANAPSIAGAVATAANKTSYLTLSYNSTDSRWDAVWTNMP